MTFDDETHEDQLPGASLARLRADALDGRLSRRQVLRRAVALGLSAPAIAGLLAACGGDDDDEPAATATTSGDTGATTPTTTESAPTPTEAMTDASPTSADDASPTADDAMTPSSGSGSGSDMAGHGRGVADLLRILYWQAPTNLNPHFSQGTKDSAAASLVLEPLFDVDADGNLVPVLAAEVPTIENGGVAADGMSVTIALLEGVVWSDGEPFSAEDVRFTWEYTTNPDTATTSFAAYAPIADVEVVDEHTVTLHYDQPAPGWFASFSTGFGGQVLPKHLLEDFTGAAARDADFNLEPVGTGPYVVADFKPGDVVVYEINENYREADKPYFKSVEWKGGGDATSAARAALESGETDWAWNLQVEAQVLNDLEQGGEGVLLFTPGTSTEALLLNFADWRTETNGARAEPTTQNPYFSDLAVRQAISLSTDKDTISEQIYGRAGVPTANALNAPPRFVSTNVSYTFDLEQAAAALDEAGWLLDGDVRRKDGTEFSILYQTTVNPVRQKTQEVNKQNWESLGIRTELKSIDAGVFFSSDAGNPDTASHFYADIEMFTNGPTSVYPVLDYMSGFKSNEPDRDIAQQSNQWSGTNYNRWVNEEYNALWEQALVELDTDKQNELFVGMNDLVINEVVVVPIVFRLAVAAASNRLRGYDSLGSSPWTPDVRNIADWYFEE